jgi:hypothetical protein
MDYFFSGLRPLWLIIAAAFGGYFAIFEGGGFLGFLGFMFLGWVTSLYLE